MSKSSLQMFEKAKRGTHIIPSVTLLHKRFYQASPLHYAVDPLGKPRRTDAPTPNNAFIKQWLQQPHLVYALDDTRNESVISELFVFENAMTAKKLEVYMWTIEQCDTLHYAFSLQVIEL